jgi:hypothetical protein
MKSQSFNDTSDTFETTMNKVLYNTFICVIGLTHLCTLIYGLTLSNDTISHNMLTYLPYRIVLSTCIFLQMGVWTVCLYSKRAMDPHTVIWGFLTLVIETCSWVGLSTILSGLPHYIFVCFFMASFFVCILILCNLTWQEAAGNVLRLCVIFMSVCGTVMLILFNHGEFYIMEHVAFIGYSLVFVAFFIAHPPSHWSVMPDNSSLECGFDIEWEHNGCSYHTSNVYLN